MSDVLSDILRSIRMRGSVFSRAELDAPWAVESGDLPFGIFHAVVRGSCWVRTAVDPPVHLERGDIVMLPFGMNHILSDRQDGQPLRVGFDGTDDGTGMGLLLIEGTGPHTTLLCGTVDFDSDTIHPTLSYLPGLVHVTGAAGFVETCIQLMSTEIASTSPGADTVIARLTEVVIVYALREYLAGLTPGQGGWLAALVDPQISRSLALIHSEPSRHWRVEELAAVAGLSRSAFFARFRELVGETPGQYLTRWRMHIAARILTEQDKSVAATARLVGYSTEAAFSNAFLRLTGVRPGAYRRSAA